MLLSLLRNTVPVRFAQNDSFFMFCGNESPICCLLSCHSCTTLWTISLITRLSGNMRDRCSAFRADAISTRPCGKGATHSTSASDLAPAHTSVSTASLASWACFVSTRHNDSFLKIQNFYINIYIYYGHMLIIVQEKIRQKKKNFYFWQIWEKFGVWKERKSACN